MHPFVQVRVAALLIVLLSSDRLLGGKPDVARLEIQYKELAQNFSESVPGWRPAAPETGTLLFVAPDQYSPVEKGDDSLKDARDKYADALFDLARQAADAGQMSLAFQWATEAVRENPDHAEARRLLGYDQRDGHWYTTPGAKLYDTRKRWNEKYGWVPMADVPRYEAGQRQIGGRWVPAKVASRLDDEKINYEYRTDHFQISTNDSLEAAADLGARLERLYQVWRQLFAGFYLTENEVRGLFAGDRQPRSQIRPFRVFYHRNRDDYNAALRNRQPRIDETLGIYFDATHEAHFFADDSKDQSTLYHEAVHQLFQESKPSTKHIAASANAWVVEGVATYFETLTEHDDTKAGRYYTIGEASRGRLPAARERLRDGSYVPLAELTRLGKDQFQQPGELAKRYSEASGLAAFLIDGEHGRYREALVRYLQSVYAGRDNDQSLSEATGASYKDLDDAYRRHMESLP
jgi:hypothetical protein